ncbi:tyrosine-type recombinase/integrase [Desulfosporosinus youngiae]|uniref:Site-specific recombinase XerD n=1 Tax=Desulfosporosinus youngiae DSM 17734 TaxID=768710 RepID=H5XVP9_9FIRM|nr:tyrosine-type recombinase/integrase [Desulfosporosinus youngiae]EHQ90205.1 site-specific recombinase XerD [Desulfosporosinus youngiae DSM 17734]
MTPSVFGVFIKDEKYQQTIFYKLKLTKKAYKLVYMISTYFLSANTPIQQKWGCFFLRSTQFEASIEEFMLYCSSKNLSKKTIKSYEQTLNLFALYLKEENQIERIEDVKKTHIRLYVKYLQDRGKYKVNTPYNRTDKGKDISVNTINNYVRNIKVFFNWLSEEDELNKNPVEKIKLLKGTERLKPLLTEQEIISILSCFDKTKFNGYRNYMITILILDTGCRITECLSIKDDDINLQNKTIVLRNTKNKKERLVFFSTKLKNNLQRWMRYKDRYMNNDLLFPTNRGTLFSICNYEKVLNRIGKKLGVELFPHRLRASFAQYYLLNGGDLITLGRILGHSSPEVTKIYLQLDDQSIQKQHIKFSPLNGMDLD